MQIANLNINLPQKKRRRVLVSRTSLTPLVHREIFFFAIILFLRTPLVARQEGLVMQDWPKK